MIEALLYVAHQLYLDKTSSWKKDIRPLLPFGPLLLFYFFCIPRCTTTSLPPPTPEPPSPPSFCPHQGLSSLQGLTHHVAQQSLRDGQTRGGCRWRPQSLSLLSNPPLQTTGTYRATQTAL